MSKHRRKPKRVLNQPNYKHNCRFCRFVKNVSINSQKVDIYHCKTCWVVHYSNSNTDIWSMSTADILASDGKRGSDIYKMVRKLAAKYEINLQ